MYVFHPTLNFKQIVKIILVQMFVVVCEFLLIFLPLSQLIEIVSLDFDRFERSSWVYK